MRGPAPRLAGAVLAVLGAASLALADEPAPPTVPLPPDVARVLTDYEAAWRAHDAAALAGLFATDGFVLFPGSAPARGRAAIERHYAKAGGALFLRAFVYATDGRLGYVVGGFSHEAGKPDDGKFTLTLVRGEGGRWLIFSDMDNGNERPRP